MAEIEHTIHKIDTQILVEALLLGNGLTKGSWFEKYIYYALADNIFLIDAKGVKDISKLDLRITRAALESMLKEACNREEFFENNKGLSLNPTETDRQATIEFVSFIATGHGFLTSQEVEMIRTTDGKASVPIDYNNRKKLLERRELEIQTAEWKYDGYYIAECQFSADPPNPTHLYMLTQAHLWAQRNRVKIKLLAGLDSDGFLARRKQSAEDPRPRMRIEKRREILESFWMLDASYEINPPENDWRDFNWWVDDYESRGTDFLFMTENQSDIDRRAARIEAAGGRVITIPPIINRVSSTDAAAAVKKNAAKNP